MNSRSRKTKDLVAAAVGEILLSDLADDVAAFVGALSYRRFAPDDTLGKRVVLHDAVRVFLAGGDRQAAELAVSEGLGADEEALVDLVNGSDGLSGITRKAVALLGERDPSLCGSGCLEIAGRTVLYHLVAAASGADTSRPLDIAGGKTVTVCYIPGSSRVQNYWDVATTSWLKRSDSLSIYPDRTFRDFLAVVGLGKEDWLAAVERNASVSDVKRMGGYMADRRAAWAAVPEWETRADLDLDDDAIVEAVDACPFGFTPMIAFNMDAAELFEMEFPGALEVTGGIIGLHDFTNGTGDPLRFEGTLRLFPESGDMHLADDQPLGLIATHGFLSSSFTSSVSRMGSGVAPSEGERPSP